MLLKLLKLIANPNCILEIKMQFRKMWNCILEINMQFRKNWNCTIEINMQFTKLWNCILELHMQFSLDYIIPLWFHTVQGSGSCPHARPKYHPRVAARSRAVRPPSSPLCDCLWRFRMYGPNPSLRHRHCKTVVYAMCWSQVVMFLARVSSAAVV